MIKNILIHTYNIFSHIFEIFYISKYFLIYFKLFLHIFDILFLIIYILFYLY